MRKLVEDIAKALVDYSDDIQVTGSGSSEVTVLELRANPDDLGKITSANMRLRRSSL